MELRQHHTAGGLPHLLMLVDYDQPLIKAQPDPSRSSTLPCQQCRPNILAVCVMLCAPRDSVILALACCSPMLPNMVLPELPAA
jgi:hypothetical protein